MTNSLWISYSREMKKVMDAARVGTIAASHILQLVEQLLKRRAELRLHNKSSSLLPGVEIVFTDSSNSQKVFAAG